MIFLVRRLLLGATACLVLSACVRQPVTVQLSAVGSSDSEPAHLPIAARSSRSSRASRAEATADPRFEPEHPSIAERVRFAAVAQVCAGDIYKGLALCPDEDTKSCMAVCSYAYDRAPGHGRDSTRARPSTASAPADPFRLVLQQCIARVRESGELPICQFTRPLDEMTFGQQHCDERCARAVGLK